jgi:hypothetical protein
MLNQNTLLSGGVTTDICMYKLQDGRFKDQFGKNSQQQKTTEKVRHIAPFPFTSVSKYGSFGQLIMKNSDNVSLDIHSTVTKKHLLKI